eukprot:Clim_evm34s119 gene=Clim_evmTU34s119
MAGTLGGPVSGHEGLNSFALGGGGFQCLLQGGVTGAKVEQLVKEMCALGGHENPQTVRMRETSFQLKGLSNGVMIFRQTRPYKPGVPASPNDTTQWALTYIGQAGAASQRSLVTVRTFISMETNGPTPEYLASLGAKPVYSVRKTGWVFSLKGQVECSIFSIERMKMEGGKPAFEKISDGYYLVELYSQSSSESLEDTEKILWNYATVLRPVVKLAKIDQRFMR